MNVIDIESRAVLSSKVCVFSYLTTLICSLYKEACVCLQFSSASFFSLFILIENTVSWP